MKNHIKNYIKIMGLAAVPFGTAQAKVYEIKVTQEHKPDAEHFKISLSRRFDMKKQWKSLGKAEIVWSHDKELPNPIWDNRGLLRKCYEGRLAREMDICIGSLHYPHAFSSLAGALRRKDTDAAHVLDWINFYRRGDASKILTDDKTLEGFLSSAEYPGPMIAENIRKKVLESKEKSGEEIVRDYIKKHSGDCVKEKHWFLRAAGLPNDCSYECYRIFADDMKDVRLYLVKDVAHLISESTYTLVVLCYEIPSFDGLRVISDIPTVFLSVYKRVFPYNTYSATNEVLDMEVRQSFSKFCTVFRHDVHGVPIPLCPYLPVRNFIRIRHSGNEAPLTGDTVGGTAVDIIGGRVIDAWRQGKHMSAQFCSLAGGKNAFKTPLLAMTRVQAFLEKLDSVHSSRQSSKAALEKRGKLKGGKTFDLSDVFTSEY